MRNLIAVAAILAIAGAASASATWNYPTSVNGLSTTITVDAAAVALLSTDALDGATLTLTQQAVPFSTPQPGPGPQVGEFMVGDFISGQEVIQIDVPAYGEYNFIARWQKLGTAAVDTPFSISFVPEPATMSLLALGGLAVLARRRK